MGWWLADLAGADANSDVRAALAGLAVLLEMGGRERDDVRRARAWPRLRSAVEGMQRSNAPIETAGADPRSLLFPEGYFGGALVSPR